MNASFEEPAIPPRLRRPLAAVWISLGLHVAVIALLQVAPPQSASVDAPTIEARLVSAEVALPTAERAAPAPEKTTDSKQQKEASRTVPLVAPPAPAEDTAADPPEPVVAQPPEAAEVAAPEPDPAAATPAPAIEASAPPVEARPPAAITSAVDLTYYSARELDTQPRALDEIVPDYPVVADRERLSGKVRLLLRLEPDGRISDIEIISSTPPGVFDEATIDAFREARFAPARRGDRPVRAQVLIEVVYDWEGRFRYPDRPASP